jgi:hypothetical protein
VTPGTGWAIGADDAEVTRLNSASWSSADDKVTTINAAYHGVAEQAPADHDPADAPSTARQIRLTPASTIAIRPVHWLWDDRIALGTLALLGGREGIGKSMVGYHLAAEVTRGQLPGSYHGQPKAVMVKPAKHAPPRLRLRTGWTTGCPPKVAPTTPPPSSSRELRPATPRMP